MVCPLTVLAEQENLAERLERLEQIVVQQQAELEENRQKLADQAKLISELQDRQPSKPGDVSGSGPKIETDPVTLAEQAQPSGTGAPAVVADGTDQGDSREESSGQQAAVAELTRREQEGTAVREVDSQATLYDPSSTVFDPNFPGAWHLPGTTAAMKLGGYVNLALINSFDPLVSTDRFIVGSIPPEGTSVPEARAGTAVSASQTRLNLEVRQQTPGGPLRAFVEGDFEGDGDSFRLRHAYGQYGWLLAGKTLSTFANQEAMPEEVDFEGINGAVLLRQSQLRFFPKFGGQNSFVFSIEDPSTDIENGTGSKGQGDFVFSVDRLPLGGLGAWNYKVSAILRDLEGTPAGAGNDTLKTQSATGWGITTSGRKSFAKMRDNNFLLWQLTYGEGIGRYLNDLNTIGGGDATFDPDGRLRALPVLAGFLSYRHNWSRKFALIPQWPGLLRSNFTLSWVSIDNYDFQDDLSYQSTWRASANLLYFPTQDVRVGAELMWGERTNKDKSRGSATQLQISARYDF
jgi:hypothetical protein